MRVAMLSKALVVGAYQKKCEELAKLVDLTVFVPPRWTESGRTVRLARTFTKGYRLVEIPFLFDGHHHVHFYPTLGVELAKLRPELLHVDEEPYNLATFLAYLQAPRPRRVFFAWQNLHRRYPPPFRWMEAWVLRRSHGAIAGNRAAVDVLRTKGYRGPAIVVPQFGVDPALFHPPSGPRPERPFTIGFPGGRLEEQKGLLDLVEACAGLRGDWRLRLVGTGPLTERLRALAAERGVAERVTIEPPVSSTEITAIYHGLDVVALPSRTFPNWKEQYGRVLNEGMACGVVAVGSDSGEIPNVIGDAGLVFPEGDVAALRAHLQRLMDDPARRDELRERGFRRVLTQARVARATGDFYRSVLNSERASSSD
jgi:glycosyltransferase involved in cell wall biosynthesis